MPHASIAWVYFITIPVGLIMFGIAIWAMRSNGRGEKAKRWEEAEQISPLVKKDRVIRALLKEGTPEAIRQAKMLTLEIIPDLKQAVNKAETLGQTTEDKSNQPVPDKEDSQTE